MYESLVRIHTNYYKNKVSFGVSHHPSLGGESPPTAVGGLVPAGFLGLSNREMSGQVDAALPGAFGHSGKAAGILASVTCMNNADD